MERFVLVMEYPGSPEKGSMVYSNHRMKAYSDYKYKLRNERNVKNHIFYSREYIENYPRHWRKL